VQGLMANVGLLLPILKALAHCTHYVLLKLPDVTVCDVAAVTHTSNSALAPTTTGIISCFTTYTVIINMIHKNSLRFSQYKMINTEKVRRMNFITKLQVQW
jgi:hypothetical protein